MNTIILIVMWQILMLMYVYYTDTKYFKMNT